MATPTTTTTVVPVPAWAPSWRAAGHRPPRPATAGARALRRLATAALLAGACAGALAEPAPSREREALRRAQAALQQANAERQALQTEKAGWQQQQQAQAAEQQRAAARLAAAQAELRRLREAETRWQAELAQAQAAAADQARQTEAERQRAAQALAETRQALALSRAEAEERSAANRALVQRLAALNDALDDARRRHEALYGLGLEAVGQLRGRGPLQQAAQDEAVLGLARVRAQDQAEQLLQRLDAQRLPPRSP